MNIKNCRVAFIAKYAPNAIDKQKIITTKEEDVYSQYHYDIFMSLSKLFPNLITSYSPDIIIEKHDDIDFVFSLLNRATYRNSEIFISSLLEYYNIPYLGARPNIRALAEDKQLAKMMCSYCGVKTPIWKTYTCGDDISEDEPFEGPFFVKPRYGASSLFIDEKSICDTWQEAVSRVMYLYSQNTDVIVERFIEGIFYSSPVYFDNLKPIFLPPVREFSNLKGNVVTYAQKRKYEDGLYRTIETDPELCAKIISSSKKLLEYITPIDYVRFDYMVTSNSEVYFIELNVCCNLGKQSAFILSANSVNKTQDDLVEKVIVNSLKRQGLI